MRRPFHAGSSETGSNFGKRRISVPSAMRPSSRASAAPRQWWMPLPNDRCCAAPGRVRSSGVGVVAPVGGVTVRRRRARRTRTRPASIVLPVDLDVGGGDASRELHRRVVAQELVDRVGGHRRVVLPPLELRPVA